VTTNDTGDIVEQNPDTACGVDVLFFDESVPVTQTTRWYEQQLPVLVVEVWSPSDRRNQMNRQLTQYIARGIPILWLVDPDDQWVAIHRPGELPIIAEKDDEFTGYGVLPDFRSKMANVHATWPTADCAPYPGWSSFLP
jgi:Uma2 family endonuclease